MFRRRRLEDFSAELRAHLELEADCLRAEGLDDSAARRRAHLNLGNLMVHEERFYEASRWAWLDQLRQDVRNSLRQLRQAPAFTITALLTLGLGIGATTAIFTLIHAVLLKSLPVARPGELYTIGDAKHSGVYTGMAGDWDIFSYDLYKDLRGHTAGFQTLAAFQGSPQRVGVRRNGDPHAAQPFFEQYVSGNYFSTFEVPAFAGRTINEDDDRPGAQPVAMIAYRTWREKFALDPAIIGATVQINGVPVTIVGAPPPGFFGDALRGNPPDLWLPLALESAVNRRGWLNNHRLCWLLLMGRIKPGLEARAIEAQMRTELRHWLTQWSEILGPVEAAQIPKQTLHLRPGGSGVGVMRGAYAAGLQLLMAISAFVLLIVCANVANLMLVRGLARRRQTSISLALGAPRSRVVRQALTESVVLGLIGGFVGLAIAFAATHALLAEVFADATVPISASPDLTVLAFAFAVSLFTGLTFGVAPAWSAHRADPVEALRGAGRATEHTGSFAQSALVVVQAALSLVLLAAAGLLTQSLRNLEHQKFGFDPGRRLAVRIDPNLAGYTPERLEPLYRTIRQRLARLPGVLSVSYALYSPMSGNDWNLDVAIDGQPPPTVDGQNLTSWNRVGPDYFNTIGTPILRGRPILESDTASTRHVAVINEAFARRFFPNENPIGKHFGADPKLAKILEIVGITADAKYIQPDRPASPMYFVPQPQVTPYQDAGTMAFESRSLYMQDVVLHFAGPAGSLEEQIRRVFAEIDPNLTIIRIRNFEAATTAQFSQERLIVRLTSLFGFTALLLASIGLYGVTSYAVSRRSKEIGIRVALGAGRDSVTKMILRSVYALVATGLAFGVPLAAAMGRLIGARLYGISWYNPGIMVGAAMLLALCALAATIGPARRAASVDPIETLRRD